MIEFDRVCYLFQVLGLSVSEIADELGMQEVDVRHVITSYWEADEIHLAANRYRMRKYRDKDFRD